VKKIALVTDSVACLTKEQIEKYKIFVVPVNLLFEGKVYKDGVDLTTEQAYQFLERKPNEFLTSAPSPEDFLRAYREATKFAKEIICLTLSSKLSATHNSARMAKELIKTELPGLKIEILDSKTIGAGQALLILTAGRLVEEGKNFEEIIKWIKFLKEKVRISILVETIRYIYRTGRIPEIASRIGGILPFKPIFEVLDGKIHFLGITSSREKGKEKLFNILKNNFDQNLPEIGIMHARAKKEAEDLERKILSLFPSTKIFISEFSPIMGYATGPGVLGIAFYSK